MKRTFSSLGCHELELDAVAALAKRHGFDSVELRSLGGTTDLPLHLAERFGSPAGFRARLDALGLAVVGFGTSFRLIDGKPEDRAALLAYVPWAEAAGVPWLRVFDGGKTGDAAEIVRGAETLAWWREERRRGGWKTDLMIETHDALVTTPILTAFFAVAPDAALLWDSHHTWKKGGEDPVATWRAVRARTVHIHVKDSVSRPTARHPFAYVPPGEGEFPMPSLLAALTADGYPGALSLEWERLWHPYLPTLEQALESARERCWW